MLALRHRGPLPLRPCRLRFFHHAVYKRCRQVRPDGSSKLSHRHPGAAAGQSTAAHPVPAGLAPRTNLDEELADLQAMKVILKALAWRLCTNTSLETRLLTSSCFIWLLFSYCRLCAVKKYTLLHRRGGRRCARNEFCAARRRSVRRRNCWMPYFQLAESPTLLRTVRMSRNILPSRCCTPLQFLSFFKELFGLCQRASHIGLHIKNIG